MNNNYINPFLAAVESVLGQFGVTGVSEGKVSVREEMVITENVAAFTGVVGAWRGNIAYCFSDQTAKKLAAVLMMGMAVTDWDELSRSALAELANLFTGNAATILAGQGVALDITPPSVIIGEQLFLVLSTVKTLIVNYETALGRIEINICLEN